MTMIDMNVSELSGAALDWAVAKCEGKSLKVIFGPVDGSPYVLDENYDVFSPSTDWTDCGPRIESNQVFLDPPHDVHRSKIGDDGKIRGCWSSYDTWHATVSARVRTLPPRVDWGFDMPGGVGRGEGQTPLIAACRAIVRSHHGDTVQLPEELIK